MVRGKTMAFIGDSVARNHFDSLVCLLSQAYLYLGGASKIENRKMPRSLLHKRSIHLVPCIIPKVYTSTISSIPPNKGLDLGPCTTYAFPEVLATMF
ncbi:hypothetical protein Fmac_006400 [Flemingia macrophylla]|uniref:Trichome birefringence-like C-terminal domain-containing protein n=1 Tax=Flemingia macrophylla TaxID=520843 RepID=A0ABD1NAJ2_9FABA